MMDENTFKPEQTLVPDLATEPANDQVLTLEPDRTMDPSVAPVSAGTLDPERTFVPDPTQQGQFLQDTFVPAGQTRTAQSTNKTQTPEQTHTSSATGSFGDMGLIPATSSMYVIKGENYQVIKHLSSNSGEADVYLVRSDDGEFVLKIYYSNYRPKEDLFKTVMSMRFELLIKDYDFGYMHLNGQEHFYEIMEYMAGGSMADFKLNGDENMFSRLALSAASSLAYLHANGIIHKDVKPGNFFYRDAEHKEMVLGDFGISCLYDEDFGQIRTTQARTPVYAAPEMYVDVIDGEVEITPAVDYYSLGISLMFLWLGRNPFTKNERVMMRMKNEGRLPEIDKMPERVRMVVRGLTTFRPNKRWTFNEVERWYKGENVPVDESSHFLNYKAFVIDPEKNIVAHDVKELAPLLNDNRATGIRFLYGKRISRWLEESGNSKLALELDDIVEHRFPIDQESGLTAAIYAMDENFPFYGVAGESCHSIPEVSVLVLKYADTYADRLKHPTDMLYVYLESRERIDRSRLCSYFSKYPKELAISRFIYETDESVPFLNGLPSSTVEEITASFGTGECTEDQWRSLIDGRLLSWLYSHQNKVMQEAVRLLTEDKPYSESLAYSVLYTINRQSAFDLRQSFHSEDVAKLLNVELQKNQHCDNEAFEKALNDYIGLTGRLHYYCTIRGWNDVLDKQDQIMNLKSKENTERLGAYDIKVAAYKFCASLGVFPTYKLKDNDGTVIISDKDELEHVDPKLIRNEMRHGSIKAWLTLFFHEDPTNGFEQDLAYEISLKEYLEFVGKFDPSDRYYKRFVNAGKETQETMEATRASWKKATRLETTLRTILIALAAAQIGLLLFLGIPHPDVLMDYIWFGVWIPLCLGSMLIGGVRQYFSAEGVTVVLLGMIGGFLSSFIPVYFLKFLFSYFPSMFDVGCAALILIYTIICLVWGHKASTKRLDDLKSAFVEDVNTQLVEPLIYTFKSHTFKYKSSKFSLMEDIAMEVSSARGELTMHYVTWFVLFVLIIVTFVMYHPALVDRWLPNTENWMEQLHVLIDQIKDIK